LVTGGKTLNRGGDRKKGPIKNSKKKEKQGGGANCLEFTHDTGGLQKWKLGVLKGNGGYWRSPIKGNWSFKPTKEKLNRGKELRLSKNRTLMS